jgi:hypothetical protein
MVKWKLATYRVDYDQAERVVLVKPTFLCWLRGKEIPVYERQFEDGKRMR